MRNDITRILHKKQKWENEIYTYLSKPITGCNAPAARTSFLILGDECTRFPITPTCKSSKTISFYIQYKVQIQNITFDVVPQTKKEGIIIRSYCFIMNSSIFRSKHQNEGRQSIAFNNLPTIVFLSFIKGPSKPNKMQFLEKGQLPDFYFHHF